MTADERSRVFDFFGCRLQLHRGDTTRQTVDVIVNAANSSLLGGGGVDGAIHRAAGKSLLEECKKVRDRDGPCAPGNAVITGAGNLSAKFVIHTVGPVWKNGTAGEPLILARCFENSLKLASKNSCSSIAFPAISTGVYGYPVELAAGVSLAACETFLRSEPAHTIDDIRFVLFSEESFEIFENEALKLEKQR